MSISSREVHLVKRPTGLPDPGDFEVVTRPVPDPEEGEVLVRNTYMSVDPYMRARMNAGNTNEPSWELDEPMLARAVGEVVASRVDGVKPGSLVFHGLGWREYSIVPGGELTVLPVYEDLSPSLYLGALGMPGLTAYMGLEEAPLRPGDTVFVSSAAGAVGSLVGQIARLRGAARVVGSAGSPEKVRYLLDELGFDAAFDYHDGPATKLLAQAAPGGIDVYYDNVGSEQLDAAFENFNHHGRVVMVGFMSSYNGEAVPGPRSISWVVGKRLTVRGFMVVDHDASLDRMRTDMIGWIRSGKLKVAETVVDGIDRAVEAFRGVMTGANTGKMIVRL